VSRFATAATFASYAGVAPVEVSSAERVRHRLPRGGDRQLNLALHIVALTQTRMPGSAGGLLRHQNHGRQNPQRGNAVPETAPGRPYLAAHDPRRTTLRSGPGRTPGGDYAIQRGWLTPHHQLFGQVTSRTRHHRLYDRPNSGLTNTEEPTSSSLADDNACPHTSPQHGGARSGADQCARTALRKPLVRSCPGASKIWRGGPSSTI
jgi:Transposase IS116/IS110/IS902 family